ncbi:alpha/beta hydrolase family protein [Planomonospora venezuelensis]|uniref:Putative dienelactone hydrolase n=1 Tax=Planomonospora venezuelensis TaxID=1999 RepID=A0A841DEQ4_PLAVE|nr:alpha/beta hydrolase [Planomonospora venezuelensis]MBB5967243.1 putative dienelactone hydrolase [Planomonospora venezuelensis]GIN03012.1 esterase [Planomonospora venezuelensis]
MRQILATTAGLVVLAASACSAPTPPRSAVPSATPTGPATLPAPTGPHPVGTTTLHLTDTTRPDPWNLDADTRELKVTLWYPTGQRDGQRAPYMTPKESELLMKGSRIANAPYDTLSKTRTNAVKDADPAGKRLPLVVLSPGFTKPVSTLTSLAEDLASRGYVVAGIDHAYESYATTLSGGRIAECIACDSDSDPGFGTGLVQGRAADVSFVLDRLTTGWKHSGLIDRTRIAMAGQSIGGASAMAAMVKDSRVRAGIDMDGTTYARIPKSGLSRPFLFIGSPQHVPGGRDTSWDRDWKLLTGWKRWLVMSGAEHQSFTDGPLLLGALGIKPSINTLPATRAAELTRTYVAAFLDRHLKSQRQPILDEPSSRHPEVKSCPAACGQS